MKPGRLRSDPQKAREWTQKSRGSLGARSAKKKAQGPTERQIRERVFERDGGCVLAGLTPGFPCFGVLTPHHRRKASSAGAYTMANIITLCVGHNEGLESNAELAALVRERFPYLTVREGDWEWDRLGRRAAREQGFG